ncbi:MAG: phage tail tape measure protein [Fusobacteriaceae bacterium]
MKQMAISFGIGATLGAGFSSAFSKAGQNMDILNKHLSTLEKKQLETKEAMEKLNDSVDPQKFTKWAEELKKTENEINATKTQMSQLENSMKSNNQVLENLNTSYADSQNMVKILNSAYAEKKKKHDELKDVLQSEAEQISVTKNRLKELKESIEKTSDPTGKLKKEQENLNLSLATLQESYKKNKNSLNESSEALAKEKDALSRSKNEKKDLEKQINATTSANKKLSSEHSRLQNGLNKIEEAYKKNNAEHKNAQGNISKEKKELEELEKAYKSLESEIGRAKKARDLYSKSDSAKNKAEKLSSIGNKSLVGGAAGVALTANITKEAIGQQSAFAGVKRMFDFDSPEAEEEFKNQLNDLISKKKMAVNVEELYAGAASVGQSGITDKGEAMKIVELGVKGGIAMDMARDEAINNFVTLKKIFKLSFDELENFSDQINYLGNTTGAGAAELIDFTKRLGSIGTEAGVSKTATTAIGATIMDMGVKSDVAATGMKNLITAFTKGQFANEKETKIFNMLGLTPEGMAKNMQKDGEGALVDFFDRISKIKNKETQVSILQEFFGKESLTSASNIASSLDALKENLAKVKNPEKYKGSVDLEYQTGADTLENKLANLSANFNLQKGKLGETLFPEIEAMVGNINNLMDKISEFQKANPTTFSVLFKGLAYGSIALIAFGGVIKIASTALTGYSLYTKLAGIATEKAFGAKIIGTLGKAGAAFKTFGAGLLANPITWYVAAAVALAGAGYLLYKNWDKVSEMGKKLWNSMPAWGQNLVSAAVPMIGIVRVGKYIIDNWDSLMEKGAEVLAVITGFFKGIGENIEGFSEKFSTIRDGIFDSWGEKIEAWKNLFTGAIDAVVEKFNNSLAGKVINTGISFVKENILGEKKENIQEHPGNIPGFAKGGIVNSPTLAWVGEGGSSESIIPHDGSVRSKNLWEKTGQLIGAFNSTPNNSNFSDTINFTYSPVITAQDSKGVKEILEKDRMISLKEFEKHYDRMVNERKRRGHGR